MEDLALLRVSIKDIWYQQHQQSQGAETFVTYVMVMCTACASYVESLFAAAMLIQRSRTLMEIPFGSFVTPTTTIMSGLVSEGVTTALG